MYSPKERIYTTPEMSGPPGNAALQQLRLEAILRKYGRLDCCEPYVYSSKPVKLPALQPPLKTIRPFDGQGHRQPYEKLWHRIDPVYKHDKHHTHDCDQAGTSTENSLYICRRSCIPGAPPNDPYLQKPRATIGGCKYGGVNLSELSEKCQTSDIFRPFYPQKSPLRLPCIQREKADNRKLGNNSTVTIKPPAVDITKHMHLLHKQKSNALSNIQLKQKKKHKKRVKLEMEFHKWEQEHDDYLQMDQQILRNMEKFHDADIPRMSLEDKERTRISDEIKQGVRRKLKMFRKDDEGGNGGNELIPVCNVTFAKDLATYEQNNTIVPKNTKKHRKKKKTQSEKESTD